MGARLLHEVREAFPPTLCFFTGVNFVVLTTNLLVAQYLVAGSNFMLATIAALVVGTVALRALGRLKAWRGSSPQAPR
jgi:hypothetical protein